MTDTHTTTPKMTQREIVERLYSIIEAIEGAPIRACDYLITRSETSTTAEFAAALLKAQAFRTINELYLLADQIAQSGE